MKNKSSLNLLRMLISGSAILLLSFTLPRKHITIFLAGDSTMADKEIKNYPETGWGMPFPVFFDTTVTVKNIARNGRSTRTFIAEGLWKSISTNLKEGDYVFIQFGHNDEVPTKGSFTTTTDFKANLMLFIRETKDNNANPVLITPVARRKFDINGKIEETHEVYAAIVRKVAEEQHIPLIDLDAESQSLLQKLGPDQSKMLFNYLIAGEHPNYPDGKADDTHFNELGARKMSELVLADIKSLKLDLAERIVTHKTK